jgi:thiosulfate dehydrogenase
MKYLKLIPVIFILITANAWSQQSGGAFEELMHISRGGQLYDNWWQTTVNTQKPDTDHPLWSEQNTNKRAGYATFRCKECHGWDYQGKDGAYGKGSHATGFPGIENAAMNLSIKQLEASLKGETNRLHDFSTYLAANDIADLALFMKKGLVDTTKFVNEGGVVQGGDTRAGSRIFKRTCAQSCHGAAGTAINFGDADDPEFVGTIAVGNPWEFIHKVKNGQPGTRMPSATIDQWSDKTILDLLSFAQTLPKDKSEVGLWQRFWGGKHHQGMMHRNNGLNSGRGFGPSIE